jgi:hypothetical protein
LLTVSGNFFWATGSAGASNGIRILGAGGGAASDSGEWTIDLFQFLRFFTIYLKINLASTGSSFHLQSSADFPLP